MRRLSILLVLLGCGCAVSEEEIQADFTAHVAASSACVEDAECAVISPGCPLGCFVAVRADAADACAAYARELIEQSGPRCVYRCAPAGVPICQDGHCTLAE